MEYERDPETELGDSSSESELPTTVSGESAAESDTTSATAQADETPSEGASDAAADDANAGDELATAVAPVSDDLDATAAATPEWPAADLPSGPTGVDDDSDAPVLADATDINLSQGGVQSIQATNVTLSQGGAGHVQADDMSVSQGGVGMARVGNLTLSEGSSAFAVLADEAHVEEGSNAFLVIARNFTGEGRATLDWRGALALGAGFGLVLSIFRRRR